LTAFIDAHRDRFGVEPICRALQIAPSTYWARKRAEREPAARTLSDRRLLAEIHRVYEKSKGLYGARKVWWQLRRDGISAPRCTVERLMRSADLVGVVRGKRRRTTVRDDAAERPRDLVDRDFTASEPNRLWVADFTYVMSWSGVVYVAFVIDAFSRRIVGWKADTTMKTSLVLDTLEMALWSRQRDGIPLADGMVFHNDAGSQYLSFAFTSRLIAAGVDPSVGSVGDAYDNALAETTIGLYKTEKINREGPWRTLAEVELATLEWVDWYNHERLHSACGGMPPTEFEQTRSNNNITQHQLPL
jgi:putative transposase